MVLGIEGPRVTRGDLLDTQSAGPDALGLAQLGAQIRLDQRPAFLPLVFVDCDVTQSSRFAFPPFVAMAVGRKCGWGPCAVPEQPLVFDSNSVEDNVDRLTGSESVFALGVNAQRLDETHQFGLGGRHPRRSIGTCVASSTSQVRIRRLLEGAVLRANNGDIRLRIRIDRAGVVVALTVNRDGPVSESQGMACLLGKRSQYLCAFRTSFARPQKHHRPLPERAMEGTDYFNGSLHTSVFNSRKIVHTPEQSMKLSEHMRAVIFFAKRLANLLAAKLDRNLALQVRNSALLHKLARRQANQYLRVHTFELGSRVVEEVPVNLSRLSQELFLRQPAHYFCCKSRYAINARRTISPKEAPVRSRSMTSLSFRDLGSTTNRRSEDFTMSNLAEGAIRVYNLAEAVN